MPAYIIRHFYQNVGGRLQLLTTNPKIGKFQFGGKHPRLILATCTNTRILRLIHYRADDALKKAIEWAAVRAFDLNDDVKVE